MACGISDINECELHHDRCSDDEHCINTVGSYKCSSELYGVMNIELNFEDFRVL